MPQVLRPGEEQRLAAEILTTEGYPAETRDAASHALPPSAEESSGGTNTGPQGREATSATRGHCSFEGADLVMVGPVTASTKRVAILFGSDKKRTAP
jgi:hypothetical protein